MTTLHTFGIMLGFFILLLSAAPQVASLVRWIVGAA